MVAFFHVDAGESELLISFLQFKYKSTAFKTHPLRNHGCSDLLSIWLKADNWVEDSFVKRKK